MDKMKMQSKDRTQENFERLAALFPNAVTETIDENGAVVRAIDKDVLQQEISAVVVEGRDERYQFTWPDKKKAILAANAPIRKTLRPCREESVNFDSTENLYIEGDNLDVLKLLQETYLGKVKMIYIDPPYNTGHDFVYNDDFKEGTDEYLENSGQLDDEGNRLFQNTESNGRFHTDWLNMLYPRLKIARDLLSDDGVIFISIDDNELNNMRRICDEIFGISNFRNTILTRRRVKSLNSQFSDNGLVSLNVGFEYILVYAKSPVFLMKALQMKKQVAVEKGRWDVFWSNADRPTMRYELLGFTPTTGQWRNSKEKAAVAVANYEKYLNEFQDKMSLEEYYKATGIKEFIRRLPNATGKNGGVQHWVAPSNTSLRTSNWTDIEVSQIGKEINLPFDNPKSKQLMMELIKLSEFSSTDIILDFFSGSATTAHAVMQLNAEDGGHRKFIMVQLPEPCDEKSEAYKAGYKNICEIGKERIRRAGKIIKHEIELAAPAEKIERETGETVFFETEETIAYGKAEAAKLDAGFRVLKLDSTNMKDVYYNPHDIQMSILDDLADNIKEDRTPEDLLFQVMLDLGILLSSKITIHNVECTMHNDNDSESCIVNYEFFDVADGFLIACFDDDVTEEVITAVAKAQPAYFVMRDSSMKNDSVATNFDQIFATYSPDTVRKVI